MGASHYESRGPYVKQFIDESTDSSEADTVGSTSLARPPSDLLYWFSGTIFTDTSVADYWHKYTGGECTRRDIKIPSTASSATTCTTPTWRRCVLGRSRAASSACRATPSP